MAASYSMPSFGSILSSWRWDHCHTTLESLDSKFTIWQTELHGRSRSGQWTFLYVGVAAGTRKTRRRRTGTAISCSRPRPSSAWAIRSTSSCTAWPAPTTATPWRRCVAPAAPRAAAFSRPSAAGPPLVPSDASLGPRSDGRPTRGRPPRVPPPLSSRNRGELPCRPSNVKQYGVWLHLHSPD